MARNCFMTLSLILVACFCRVLSVSRSENKWRPLLVHTNYGPVQGFREYTQVPLASDPTRTKRVQVATWLGIPYAEAPVGLRRFRAPIPKQPWTKTLQASTLRPSCYHQLIEYFSIDDEKMWLPPDVMDEDCLYLNIWAPAAIDPSRPKLPVLIWIYGGGFISGTANLPIYNGRILAATNNVIVATIQYRIGMLGFLYTPDESCPGNQGLLDQHLGIRWLFENIEYFGGDQRSITLFGESSGAVSVGLHLLSPMSSPYFKRAVMQSGSPTARWSVISTGVAEERTKRMLSSPQFLDAVLLDEPTEYKHIVKASITRMVKEKKYKKLLQYLRKMPVAPKNDTWNYHWSGIEVSVYSGAVGYGLVPVIDNRFIIDNPQIVMYKGRFKPKPLLIGTNGDEGTYFNAYVSWKHKVNLSSPSPRLPKELFKSVLEEAVLTYYPFFPVKPHRALYDSIYLLYLDHDLSVENETSNAVQLGKVTGDLHFSCPTLQFADFMSFASRFRGSAESSNDSNVFVYYFNHLLSYRGMSGETWPRWMGVLHGDEILFIFGDPWNPASRREYTKDEKQLSLRIMRYWTNFATYGHPWPEDTRRWPNYHFPERNYLEITSTQSKVGKALRARFCFFWDQYVPQLMASVRQVDDFKAGALSQRRNFMHASVLYVAAWLL